MPVPYTARVDVRRFLNLPGFHGGAHVVVYVEDTSKRRIEKRDDFGDETARFVNPTPRVILEIADCSDRIQLELEVETDARLENSLHKIDTLVDALGALRAGLVEEARLYRAREPETARLNAKTSRARSSRSRGR
ncbi:MAG TPA: hypothetical protein VFJ77_08305 [Gaiellaceae bacterium]|nr:hypothetical protein [Gaiellaceae bacterium]